jgi:tripartite-type tricarboxylate transporter receptor subunit TctC
MRSLFFVLMLFASAWIMSAAAYAQTDFYKGKTITVVQIVGAGGTGDLRRRALFPYLQKYIPGNPTIVSDYMPGGGGRKAANHVYRVAKPDGLTIGGMSSSLVTNAILDTAGVQYDIDKLIYLGSPVSVFHYVFLTRREAASVRWRNYAPQRACASAPRRSATISTSPGGCSLIC